MLSGLIISTIFFFATTNLSIHFQQNFTITVIFDTKYTQNAGLPLNFHTYKYVGIFEKLFI